VTEESYEEADEDITGRGEGREVLEVWSSVGLTVHLILALFPFLVVVRSSSLYTAAASRHNKSPPDSPGGMPTVTGE
jgi:hypothetical protein